MFVGVYAMTTKPDTAFILKQIRAEAIKGDTAHTVRFIDGYLEQLGEPVERSIAPPLPKYADVAGEDSDD